MKTLFLGADWIMKYLIGDMLLNDQDEEDDITVFTTMETVNNFYDFPPLQKFAGDERLTVANTLELKKCIEQYGPFDVVVVSTNIIKEVEELITFYSAQSHARDKDYLLEHPLPKFLVISTWEVYGWVGRRKLPIDEKERLDGETPLGLAKKEIEKLMDYAFDCTIFRFSTIFGPYMPEDDDVIQWLMNMILSRPIVVSQPAGRKIDFCYVYNVLAPIQKAMERSGLPKYINLGSADSDYKQDGKLNIFEKNVIDALKGIRVLIDSRSSLAASDEDATPFQGKGFHSQLKTENARKYLDYFPIVDTLKGFLQTCHWLQKRMETDPQFMGLTGRSIEDIYPTLDEKKMYKVGEEFKTREVEITKAEADKIIEEKNKPGKIARSLADAETGLVCDKCQHVPSSPPSTEDCKCPCHTLYKETDEVV